jgi:rRNA maturation protein Nop10
MKRTIFENETHLIVEHLDQSFDLENLKGDSYNPEANPDIDSDILEAEEQIFETLVENEGVFGYTLEKKCPTCGNATHTIGSCWGFVGRYSETDSRFKHYIVEELKNQIK